MPWHGYTTSPMHSRAELLHGRALIGTWQPSRIRGVFPTVVARKNEHIEGYLKL